MNEEKFEKQLSELILNSDFERIKNVFLSFLLKNFIEALDIKKYKIKINDNFEQNIKNIRKLIKQIIDILKNKNSNAMGIIRSNLSALQDLSLKNIEELSSVLSDDGVMANVLFYSVASILAILDSLEDKKRIIHSILCTTKFEAILKSKASKWESIHKIYDKILDINFKKYINKIKKLLLI